VCDYVLEHVADPVAFTNELVRVLRPGGAFVARTVSRSSPLSLFARIVPNGSHARVLEVLQPGRTEKDVFPTEYKMNSRKSLHALFDADFEWAAASRTSLDQYLLPWPRLGRAAASVERRLPRAMQSALVICARKRGGPS
jgi:2-polyprenyl-3-methyl-5-hydroxy-6-metoxy-1,4-benzoquinol methylase